MEKPVCSLCGIQSSEPYRCLFKLDDKLFCRNCAIRTYDYEEVLKRLSQVEGFTCDFCKERRIIGFNTSLSNKFVERGKTKCAVCYYESKTVECCEILSLFASHAKKNITGKEEEEWFNDFTFRFFEVLKEKNKLCGECLKFLEEREDEN